MAIFGFIIIGVIFYAVFLPKKAQQTTNKAAVRLVRGKYHQKRKSRQRKKPSISNADQLRLKELKLAAQLKEVRAQLRKNA